METKTIQFIDFLSEIRPLIERILGKRLYSDFWSAMLESDSRIKSGVCLRFSWDNLFEYLEEEYKDSTTITGNPFSDFIPDLKEVTQQFSGYWLHFYW